MSEPWSVYIIKCNDDKLYTGIAKDVDKRVSLHNKGLACRFTKYRCPVVLLYTEQLIDYSSARKREGFIKGLTKQKKLELISQDSSSRKHGIQNQFFASQKIDPIV